MKMLDKAGVARIKGGKILKKDKSAEMPIISLNTEAGGWGLAHCWQLQNKLSPDKLENTQKWL